MIKKNKDKSMLLPAGEQRITIKTKSKCDIAMDMLLEFIVTGEYMAGDRLPSENYFVESFNVSRVTIRESIKKLSSMGVVSVKQGLGTFVNKISPSTFMLQLYPLMMMNSIDVLQLYDARMYLESGIAVLAAKNRTEEDLKKMKILLPLMSECVKKADFNRYNELDIEFHKLIGIASKNDILLTIYKMLGEVRKRGIFISNSTVAAIKDSIKKHKKLLEAIEKQDCEISRTTMIDHINYSKAAAVKRLAGK